ncbi:MAG: pyruvate synthase [Candidatus Nitronauta litoralis]|uniref:Pyruvate synthase n=1 Tax=Candidatus Nitronauta litoralis TaxID=2705533 RepID=A0A7T0BV44_9BACT|nr:MAG: pyruvate synthase [Candidatus Nitronauta litoralis]
MNKHSKMMLTGNKAAAWGVRLAQVDYVPAFPITPQTEIVETLAQWFSDGTLTGKYTNMDSEHSMFMAAGAAAATGVRVFTASSSQGILHGMEALYTIAGWRVPLVMVNVSRALATPITLEPDHNDVMSTRDCGMVQLHAETCQEVLDFILIGHRIAEHPQVALPVLVNMDGFYLSFTREPVVLPEPSEVARFLPPYKSEQPVFKASQPMARASAVFGGATYSYFKIQQDLAVRQAETVFHEVSEEFAQYFGRNYGPVENFMMDDAEFVFVMSNSFATKGKAAVLELRKQGIKAGLLKLRLIRPFPTQAIADSLLGHHKVAVIDQNLSPGMGGILFPEIVTSLYSRINRPEKFLSVIGGLGGKDILKEDFFSIVEHLRSDKSEGPLFLYNDDDLKQFKKVSHIALAEKGGSES